jgi:hypothetical protein
MVHGGLEGAVESFEEGRPALQEAVEQPAEELPAARRRIGQVAVESQAGAVPLQDSRAGEPGADGAGEAGAPGAFQSLGRSLAAEPGSGVELPLHAAEPGEKVGGRGSGRVEACDSWHA